MDDIVEGSILRKTLGKRYPVLEMLVHTPLMKPELVNNLGVSRSTVDRAIEELENMRCVKQINSTYQATVLGTLVFSEYQQYAHVTDTLSEAVPLLEALPDDIPNITPVLRGANIYLAPTHAPETVFEQITAILDQASRLRGLTPVVSTSYFDTLYSPLKKGLTAEIIVEDDVYDVIEESYNSIFEEIRATGSVDFYTSDTEFPFALWLMHTGNDEYAALTVYENGGIRGVAITQAQSAVNWASHRYRQHKQISQKIK